MNLPARIAVAMSTGAVDRLPRLTRHASPDAAAALLKALYRLRDAVAEDVSAAGSCLTLADRIAAASVRRQVELAINETHGWLRRCAEHGGMGVSP